MTPKEKKAFVKKMREAKEAKAKERKKSTKSKRFSISSSERKQTKNLNVYSPPPESYTTVTGTAQAKKVAKEKRKIYTKVKIWRIKE